MMPPIVPPSLGIEGIARPEATRAAEPGLGDSFRAALHEASSAERASTTAAEQFANGDPSIGIHEVMIASEKANLAVRFATTLKNKALEAYRELMSTQV